MRYRVLGLILCFSVVAYSQDQSTTTTATPQKDPQATASMQRGFDALGGPTAVASADNCLAQGTLTRSTDKSSSNFVWKNSGEDFRYEVYSGTGLQIVVSNHSDPVWIHGKRQTKLFYHSIESLRPLYLVGRLVQSAVNDPNTSITVSDQVGSAQTRRETDLFPKLSQRNWTFDGATGLPIRITYFAPQAQDANSTTFVTVNFGDYRKEAGILIPHQITTTSDGATTTAVISSVSCGITFSPSDFEAPTGGAQ
jgi:hypothetical protein